MPAQEKPVKLIEATYKPMGSPHRVKTGESWESLAKGLGIDSWDLIDYNFPGLKLIKQRNGKLATRYVNWYLAAYVGCTIPAPPDGQNFAFSSGLTGGKGVWKGGYIYLPPISLRSPIPSSPPRTIPLMIPPACEATRPDNYRLLTQKEQALAGKVFGKTLPPWNWLAIGNGLGVGGAPWTSDGPFITGGGLPGMRFAINLGEVASLDLTSQSPTLGWLCGDFGRICDLFIHEMTHVWQMFNDSSWVMLRSVWAQKCGAGYEYKPGDSWESYNVEQQAHLVEDWHRRMSLDLPAEDLYPYVRLVVRSGRLTYPRGLDLEALKNDLQSLRSRRLD